MNKHLKYKRIILKLSGEALAGADGKIIDTSVSTQIVEQIRSAHEAGAQIAIVIGGGNIIRGKQLPPNLFPRHLADNMGMLATLINSLALKAILNHAGIDSMVFSALTTGKIAQQYSADEAREYLKQRRIVIIGAGTGNPFFTTDTAAALRCAELQADALLKATKVDGIYDSDPVKNKNAKKIPVISYSEALRLNLKVMDATAFSFCMENSIPIIVFKLTGKGTLLNILKGKHSGSIVTKGE